MTEGQSKAFENEINTLLTITENQVNTKIPAQELNDVNTYEMRINQLYDEKRRRKISRARASRII